MPSILGLIAIGMGLCLGTLLLIAGAFVLCVRLYTGEDGVGGGDDLNLL